MVTLARVRPQVERPRPDSPRAFGCLVIDEGVLYNLLGLEPTSRHGIPPGPTAFERAASQQGQLALRQRLEQHQALQGPPSPSRLFCSGPGSSGPGGGGSGGSNGGADALAFAGLLSRLLPGLALWQVRDVWAALRGSDEGQAGAQALQLAVLLVAATACGEQRRAVYAFGGAVHRGFACGSGGGAADSGGGGGGGDDWAGGCGRGGGAKPAPMRGVRAAALLLGVPPARLYAAAERLGLAAHSGGQWRQEDTQMLLYAALGAAQRGSDAGGGTSGGGGGGSSGGGSSSSGAPTEAQQGPARVSVAPAPGSVAAGEAAAQPGCCGWLHRPARRQP